MESHVRGDALDLTWATFWAVVVALPKVRRIEQGRPPSHAEEAAEERARKELEL